MINSDKTVPRILVAGIGNIFLGDDAFGVEVAQRLMRRALPDGVRVVDFGIRGLDLVYALLEDYEGVILVDATRQGGTPGTVYVLEPERPADTNEVSPSMALDTHEMNPMKVLECVYAMGGRPKRLLVVGCEPATGESDEQMGLSEPVDRAVADAIRVIESLIAQWTGGSPAVGVAAPPGRTHVSGEGSSHA